MNKNKKYYLLLICIGIVIFVLAGKFSRKKEQQLVIIPFPIVNTLDTIYQDSIKYY